MIRQVQAVVILVLGMPQSLERQDLLVKVEEITADSHLKLLRLGLLMLLPHVPHFFMDFPKLDFLVCK